MKAFRNPRAASPVRVSPSLPPIAIQLSADERDTLALLTRFERSALAFWQAIIHSRRITIPADKVIRLEPSKNLQSLPGQYLLRFERKALSQQAINEGRAFAAYAAQLEAKQESAGKWKNFREVR